MKALLRKLLGLVEALVNLVHPAELVDVIGLGGPKGRDGVDILFVERLAVGGGCAADRALGGGRARIGNCRLGTDRGRTKCLAGNQQ